MYDGIYNMLLLIAAVIPAVLLCVYIYKKDRIEKEPMSLLLLLLALGGLSTFVAAPAEGAMTAQLRSIMKFFGAAAADGSFKLTSDLYTVYYLAYYFICIALVEELLKWLILVFTTRNNKNFNSLFDGMVYSVFISLGFALTENTMYVAGSGFQTALLRALTAIPSHAFDGVFMGYFYSLWNVSRLAGRMESRLSQSGIINLRLPKTSGTRFLILSLAVPVLLHGLYDFLCAYEGESLTSLFVGFVVFLYVYGFGKVRSFSQKDVKFSNIVTAAVCKKYRSEAPHIIFTLHQQTENAQEHSLVK